METYMVATGNNPSLVYQLSNTTGKNPLDELPEEISLNIFRKLQPADIEASSLVCKQWNVLANYKDILGLWKGIPANAFGPKQWEEYFGVTLDSKDIPPLPLNIHKINKSQCSFSEKGIKVEDAQLLVLVPGSIDGKNPLTLKTFGELVKLKFPELDQDQNGYGFLWDDAKECGGNGKSHWVLMTNDILKGSREKSFAVQQKQIEDDGKGNYQVPEALDAVVCAISEYARSGGDTRLLSDVFTLCPEKINGFRLVVGGFAPSGLRVSHHLNYDYDSIGVAALRKL